MNFDELSCQGPISASGFALLAAPPQRAWNVVREVRQWAQWCPIVEWVGGSARAGDSQALLIAGTVLTTRAEIRDEQRSLEAHLFDTRRRGDATMQLSCRIVEHAHAASGIVVVMTSAPWFRPQLEGVCRNPALVFARALKRIIDPVSRSKARPLSAAKDQSSARRSPVAAA